MNQISENITMIYLLGTYASLKWVGKYILEKLMQVKTNKYTKLFSNKVTEDISTIAFLITHEIGVLWMCQQRGGQICHATAIWDSRVATLNAKITMNRTCGQMQKLNVKYTDRQQFIQQFSLEMKYVRRVRNKYHHRKLLHGMSVAH